MEVTWFKAAGYAGLLVSVSALLSLSFGVFRAFRGGPDLPAGGWLGGATYGLLESVLARTGIPFQPRSCPSSKRTSPQPRGSSAARSCWIASFRCATESLPVHSPVPTRCCEKTADVDAV